MACFVLNTWHILHLVETPNSQAHFGEDTSVVDRLQFACRAEIARLVKLYGDYSGPLDGGTGGHLAKLLPALARRPEGQQVLEKLALMTAAELERFLVGPTCDAQFRALLENYLVAGGSKSPHRSILRSRSAAALGRRTESSALVAGPLSELLCLPLTVGRAETPSQEKGRSNRRVMMKRSPAESLMAAAAEAGDVDTESAMEVAEDEKTEKSEKSAPKSRPSSGRSRASSRPSSGRPPSRGGRDGRLSRPGSAKVDMPAVAPLQLPPHSLEQDALTSFVSQRERIESTKVSLSPSPSRRRNLERTPLTALLPKGDEHGSSPFSISSRMKLLQFATYDIEL